MLFSESAKISSVPCAKKLILTTRKFIPKTRTNDFESNQKKVAALLRDHRYKAAIATTNTATPATIDDHHKVIDENVPTFSDVRRQTGNVFSLRLR